MKTSSLHYRALVLSILVIGVVSAVPAADLGLGDKASQFAPRAEKRAGFFSRLFGHGSRTSNKPDRDDDDDDQRDRDDDDNHSPRTVPLLPEMTAPRARTVVITTTSTPRVPTDPQHLDTYRIPLVQAPVAIIAPPTPQSATPARLSSPRDVPQRDPVPTEIRIDTATPSHPQSGVIRTVSTPSQPVLPAPSATVPTPVADANPAASQLLTVSSVEKPASPPAPPFGKPVPGRAGMVYPPGVKETTENMLDVRDIPPGTKVRDPVTKTVFLVP